jgi:hypothetical protein
MHACFFLFPYCAFIGLVKRTRPGTKKDRTLRDDQYVQESAWFRLRQAAHHWTTVVTLQKMETRLALSRWAGHFMMR